MRRGIGRGWWHRNRWGLAGFALVLPLSLWLVFANGWYSYYESRPSQPHTIDAGAAEKWAGGEFAILAAERLGNNDGSGDGTIENLPAGTELVTVTMRVVPPQPDQSSSQSETQNPFYCTILLTAASGAGQWNPLMSDDFGWERDADASIGGCDSAQEGSYLVQSSFLVPTSAEDDLRLRVVSADRLPAYLDLKLPFER